MWTVIYMTKDECDAAQLRRVLEENGIMVMVRGADGCFEVYVPSQEVNQAHNIIIETEI